MGLLLPGAQRAAAIIEPAAAPATVTADALPTWQINGVVWSQVVIGNTVYATGEFSQARPPGVAQGGAGSVAVSNLIAYDIRTGNPVSSFNHTLNAQGMTIAKSPDGSRIYVGGDFTAVDGQARGHIAAFDTATGALVQSFQPNISGRVRAIAVSDTTVYAGGEFGVADNTPRTRLAAFGASAGNLLPWNPTTDNYYVWSMVLTPNQSKVIVGGQMQKINGVTVNGMAALDASSGEVLPWAANQTIVDYNKGAIMGLKTDGEQIYGSGFAFGSGGRFEGEFAADPETGAINWLNDCQGDTYDTWPMDGVLYTVSHVHNCEMIGGLPQLSDWGIYQRHALAFGTQPNTVNNGPDQYGWNYKGIPGSKILTWFPDVSWGNYTQYGQSGWSVTGNGDYLAMGGEFLAVNGRGQQGLVRFAVHSNAPNKMGPSVGYGSTAPSATSRLGGTAVVSWNAAWDPDNTTLTYRVYRAGVADPVYTTTHDSLPWDVPRMNFVDGGLAPGSTQTYTIKVNDPDGNVLTLAQTNPVLINSGATSVYAVAVLQDGAGAYWRLGEPSGTTVADWAGSNNAVAQSGVTRGTAGAIANDPDTASTFSGTTTGYATAQTQQSAPNIFTAEAWFKTASNRGGKIIGFGNKLTGNSSSYDRHVYMDNNGRLWFGVYPGGAQIVNTSASYNDGQWHQVVASLGPDGMRLYIDGALQAERSDVTAAQAYNGYWRIGGDTISGWPSAPSSSYFGGSIDEVAVYPNVLTPQQVATQYQLGTTGTAPNQSPVAAFTSSVDGLSVSVDGSGSVDPDGSISSYAWDFGDGTPAGSGVKPEHTYGSAGTYTVKLAVTDNDGATDSVSHDVTVAVPGGAIVVDDFNRTVSDGLGSADTGGSWTLQGPASRFSVDGAAGQLQMVAGSGTRAYLGSVSAVDVDLSVDVALGKVPQGGSVYTSAVVRSSAAGDTFYAVKVQWLDSGAVRVFLSRTVNWLETTLAVKTVAGLSGSDSVTVRMQAVGSAPTTLQAKAWKSRGAEPSAWAVSATDATAGLQGAGGIGLVTYLSGITTNGPIVASFDNLAGYRPDDAPPPPANQPPMAVQAQKMPRAATPPKKQNPPPAKPLKNADPVAALTSSVDGLSVSLDGSGSVDPDGSISSYAWDFGDGTPAGSGVMPEHTYGSAGTYTVKLTVTDNGGATMAVAHRVKVVVPNRPPVAAFTSSVDGLSVSLDGSGSVDPDGSISSYAWDFGDGTPAGSGVMPEHTYGSAGTYTVKLTVTDNGGATTSISRQVIDAAGQ